MKEKEMLRKSRVLAFGCLLVSALSTPVSADIRTNLHLKARPLPWVVGEVYSSDTPVTVCLRKEEFEQIISAESSGKDGAVLFKSFADCNTIRLPHVLIVKRFQEFTMRDGRRFSLVQLDSLDHSVTLFAGMPVESATPDDAP